MFKTCANVDDLDKELGFMPNTSIETGIDNFVAWYREFFKIYRSSKPKYVSVRVAELWSNVPHYLSRR